jgi:hypothetical protein
MVCCAYCEEPATLRIVSNPEQVCLVHALEFWTGLLTYVRDPFAHCVKYEGSCSCRACEEMSAASARASAIAAAGPAPQDDDRFQIRLAS